MVDSIKDCAHNQGVASARQMFAVADGLGKGCKEVGVPLWEDVVKEIVVVVLNMLEELLPALPHVIVFWVSTSNRCVSAGSCCSSAVNQETTAGDRGLIWKLSGSWLGTAEERREAR